MRSGKDEEEQMDPLFPKLHINDTGKGGPRGTPRNKMALCEEISVPPQRPSSGSISMQPLPPCNDSSLNLSGSQSHVGSPQNSRFSLLCSWPGSSERAEDHHSNSASLINFDVRLRNNETQILSQKFSSIRPSKMIAECHLSSPFIFYNSENSPVKTLGKEDNFRLPNFSQLDKTLHCGIIGDKLENKKLTSSSLSSSGRHQTTFGRREEEVKSTDLMSREHLGNWTDDNHEVSQMREENSETPSPLSIGKKILLDTAVNQLTRNTTSDSGTRAPLYQAQCYLDSDKIRLHDPCNRSHKGCRISLEIAAGADGIYENLGKFSRKRSYSTMESPLCSSTDPEENNQTLNMKECANECPTRDNDLEVGDAKRSIAISGTSVVDSKSGFNISPDDVVGILGLKLFWQIRRTIAHQQRIFAVQIFELHRLIKVQRLVAKSPEMLSEEILQISKPSIKCSPIKKQLIQITPEATSSLMKPTVDSQRPNLIPAETAVEDTHAKPPPPECDSDQKGHITPRSTLRPCSRSSTCPPFSSDVKLGPGYFRSGNQWLVPVRSPSEGLVYKPYTGPLPPTLDCIAPIYGTHGAPSLSRIDKDSITYGVPTPSQPYVMPVVNTSNSGKCLPASKESDVNCSTVNGPVKRVQGDAHSLFPIESPFQTSCKPIPSNTAEMQKIEVIKVVPHNPKLACESAARIFKSIQEERQKHN